MSKVYVLIEIKNKQLTYKIKDIYYNEEPAHIEARVLNAYAPLGITYDVMVVRTK